MSKLTRFEEETSPFAISVEAPLEVVEPTTNKVEGTTIAPSRCCCVEDKSPIYIKGITINSFHS